MMRVLRRQVRRLRRALMADQPPQDRTMVIVTGLGLTADDETRAWICDMIDKVQRERGDVPEPPPPTPAIAEVAPKDEERPAHFDLKITGPAPPMTPEQLEKWWDGVEAEYKRHEAEVMGKAVEPAQPPLPEPPARKPWELNPRLWWEEHINKPPPGPRPPPPRPWRDPIDDPLGLYDKERGED